MKSKIFIILLTILSTLTACESIIQIDTPTSLNNIVVEANLSTQEQIWQVQITNSQAYYNQDSAQGAVDALVIISDNLGTADTLYHEKNGLYKSVSAKKCVPGLTYFLSIKYNDETYEASDYCRYQNPIDTFTAYYLPENNGFIEKGWYAFQQSIESEIEGDYYEWKIYRNDTLQDQFGFILDEDLNREISFFNMDVDPADPLSGIDEGILPRPYPFKFNPGDTIIMEQFCFNKGYYDFLFEVQNQLNRGGTPFDPPPANPNSNISNGAYGYFSVNNQVTARTIIPQ